MRLSSALVLSAAGAAADNLAARGTSWSPPKQTDQSNLQYGRAPKPTEAPRPGALFGRMPLQARLAGFVMDPAICGYDAVVSDHSIGCGIAGQTCTYSNNGYGGCCPATGSCSSIQTTCVGGDDAKSCIGGSSNTLCCADAGANQCYTWIFSTTAVGGQPGRRNTLFSCAVTAAMGTLLDYDPQWSKTHFPQSTSTFAPISTGGSGPGLSVGAIVGIVIGAVVVLAIVLAALCLRRRSRKNKGASSKKEKREHHRAVSELSGSEPPNRGRPTFNESPFSPNQQTGVAAAKARRELSPLASDYSLSSHGSQDRAQQHPQHQRWGSLDQHATPSPVPKDEAKSPKMKSPESYIAELPDHEMGTRGNRAELG